MPDFTPDTSIYRPQNQMDAGSMLNLIQTLRGLNTQSGIASAIRANPNDPTAAYSAAARNPNVMMGPGDVTNFVHAQQAQSELRRYYTEQVGKGVVGLYNNPKPTEKDWANFAATASTMGVPADILTNAHNKIVRPDGSIDKNAIADFWGTISGGQDIPRVSTVNPETQQPVNVPAGRSLYGGAGPGPQGSVATGAPPFQAKTQAGATEAQQSLQEARAGPITQNRMLLSNMLDLSREAATGPGANWQVNWSKLMANLGMPQFASMTPDQVASSENFKKIAERLVNQMATTGGHITNDFLHNAYGSNPGLEISRQGREGMITWLQGITDVQNLIGKNWENWLNQPENVGKEGQFYKWAGGQIPGGMNLSNLDMRVFQFERMNPDEQDKFLASMTRKGEREEFLTHHRDYDRLGWLDSARQ